MTWPTCQIIRWMLFRMLIFITVATTAAAAATTAATTTTASIRRAWLPQSSVNRIIIRLPAGRNLVYVLVQSGSSGPVPFRWWISHGRWWRRYPILAGNPHIRTNCIRRICWAWSWRLGENHRRISLPTDEFVERLSFTCAVGADGFRWRRRRMRERNSSVIFFHPADLL